MSLSSEKVPRMRIEGLLPMISVAEGWKFITQTGISSQQAIFLPTDKSAHVGLKVWGWVEAGEHVV